MGGATLTAQWTGNSYTVTFDGNGGSTPSPVSQPATYGSAYGTLANVSRSDYTFTGWYTASAGGTQVTAATIVLNASNHTLYAHWTVNQYTISFNSNGGSGVASITQDYGTVVIAPAAPTKPGNAFGGWYSDTGLTVQYTFNRMPAQNVTLYAKWNASGCVVSNAQNSGAGSLRQLLIDCPAGGTITFAGDYTISLASTLTIAKNITVDGAGHAIIISGNRAVGVFKVNVGMTAGLKNLAINQGYNNNTTGNNNKSGGGIWNNGGTLTVTNCAFTGNRAEVYGGGIFNDQNGTLTVTNSTFSGNSAASQGGGIYSQNGTLIVTNSTFTRNATDRSFGGGITSYGALMTVTDSTFSGNASGLGGGGIFGTGTLTVTNSTFFGNRSKYAGGIGSYGGTLTVTNSTFSGNSATEKPDGFVYFGGGGIYNGKGSSLYIKNTIVANSTGNGRDCSNYGTISVNTNNLIQDSSCRINATGFKTGDPKLGALQDNGGRTLTMALLPGSPAIDAGANTSCPATDQRGIVRPQNATCDIGAYEVETPVGSSGYIGAGGSLTVSSAGITVTVTDNNGGGAVPGNTTITIYNMPPAGVATLPNQMVFWVDINAATKTGLNVTLQVCYDPNLIPAGVDEANLAFYSHDGSGWVKLNTTISNTTTHCASIITTHLSTWTLAPSAPPQVSGITLLDPNFTDAPSVAFRVAFTQIVTNVTSDDFGLTTVGSLSGVSITSIKPDSTDGSVYTVTVNVGSGVGTIRLDLNNGTDVQATDGTAIGGGFTGGEEYTIAHIVTFEGNGADSGTMDPQSSSAAANLMANAFTRTDHTFAGWGTASGGPVVYSDGAVYDFSADIILYAQWTITSTVPSVVPSTVPSNGAALLPPGPSQIKVTFSEDVNHVSTTDAGSATNPANYILVEAGANVTFNTIDCAHGVATDDIRITINSINYDPATFTATLKINGGVPLPAGTYRLYVCGTTSIEDPTGNKLNNGASDTLVNFTVGAAAAAVLPSTGFAPDRVTVLPPPTMSYADLGDLWLEIPKLGVQMAIVGVPQADGKWDVSWLGNDAGWLNGSAFPTWAGNSVLTGHVWNADNTAGPFAYLNQLWYGDKVIVHAWGGQYVYEVRSVQQVGPGSTAAMMKHEELPWVTLVTCRGYDEASNSYKYRVLVRAVLVEVK